MKNKYKLSVKKYIENFNLVSIFQKIQKLENQIYFVGGASRSIILKNFKNNDLDLVVPRINDEILQLLKSTFKVTVNDHYKSLSFKYNNLDVQISSFRKDVNYYGRQAKVDFTKNIETDSIRRDLTFNSIYINLLGDMTDFHSGEADLLNSKLKFLGNPADRIQEDYLRAIRYIRFLSLFKNPIPRPEDVDAIKMLSKNIIDFVKVDKIQQEISKINKMDFPHNSYKFINENKELFFLKNFLN